MRARLSLALLLAASACTCGTGTEVPADGPAVVAPPPTGLRGTIALGPDGGMRPLPGVELQVVPEEVMIDHLARKIAEARAAMPRISAQQERVRAEARTTLAENDRRSQEWKATNDDDLFRRVEVLLRRPRDPREVADVHGDLLARKKAAYRRAVQAARISGERERDLLALEREASRYRAAAFFVAGLPAAARTGRSSVSGEFALDLPPGRYALVATAEPGSAGAASPAWLLWVQVHGGGDPPLLLGESNQHGTDCDACVVILKEMR